MSIGENIRKRREEMNLTQIELAEAVCITNAMLSKIENNVKSPSSPVLFLIADKLNCKADDLRD